MQRCCHSCIRCLRLNYPSLHPRDVRRYAGRSSIHTSTKEDDYYDLLLADPLPDRPPTTSESSSNPNVKTPDPRPRVLFSTPLAGPSARMRELARGTKGLERPPEPENCCMSGCVNCVWDTYREEIEQWAKERRQRESAHFGSVGSSSTMGEKSARLGSGNLDETKTASVANDEDQLFEGVPVGIREFMLQEKRLRERKENREKAG